MKNSRCIAVYNAPIPEMPTLSSRSLRVACFLLLSACLFSGFARALDSQAAAGQLARKIVAATGSGAISVEVVNRSSLSKTESEQVHHDLLTELAAAGAHFAKAEPAITAVRISLSEDLPNYVWIAEIQPGNSIPAVVVMVSLPRPEAPAGTRENAALSIRKALLWSQTTRILDVAIVSANPQQMLVLDPANVTIYRLQGGSPNNDNRWQIEQSLPITHARPWPRDLRGRLVLRKDHLFDAYLPGVVCRSTPSAPFSLTCTESDDLWPLSSDPFYLTAFFTPSRNFFTGALFPGVVKQTMVSAFFSAAPYPKERYTLWIFTAVDGQVHLLDGVTDLIAAKTAWGSDIAGVRSNCGTGWQILATGANSGGDQNDFVRAYEMPDHDLVATSLPLELQGNITALWMQPNFDSAVAVSHDGEKGQYEAFRLSIACSQ